MEIENQDDDPPLTAEDRAWIREGVRRDRFWKRAKVEAKTIGGWFFAFVAVWVALKSLGIDPPEAIRAFVRWFMEHGE
ncbi:MAG: hypothetical protein AAFQ81_05645 [Pseudomonadota bacterium]